MKKTNVQSAGALTQKKTEPLSLKKTNVEGFLDAAITQLVNSPQPLVDTERTHELIERCFILADRLTITNKGGNWQVRGRSRIRNIKNYTSNEPTLFAALRNFFINATELYKEKE